jgi:gamma-glutamylcyclotransferase (GGCT)/AIG2-like uncharacterized protein YtfP
LIPIFVYGTLKKSGRGHHLLKNCKFLSEVTTKKNYKLYSKISYPCMVLDLEDPKSVPGELYLADLYTIKVLNEYEGVDVGLYSLSVIELDENTFKNKEIVVAHGYCMSYIYLGDVSYLKVIDQWQEQLIHEY